MSLGLHFLKDVFDFSVRPDQEGGAGDPHDLLAVHVFLFHYTVSVAYFLVDVGQECVGQLVFFLEFLLFCGRVGGDPEDYGTGLLNFFVCVTKLGRLNGSTRGIGLRIKEQHHGFAAEIL